MSSSLFQHVRGVVLAEPSQSAVAGVQVTATLIEKGRLRDNERLLSRATTDDDGMFNLRFKTAALASGRIRFDVVDAKVGVRELAEHSEGEFSVSDLPTTVALCIEPVTVCPYDDGLDEPSAVGGSKVVYGVVRHEDGTPAPGLDLEVFRVKVSGEVALTTSPSSPTTDSHGEYSLLFTDDSNPYNLLVVVSEAGPTEVGKSDVYYKVGDVTRIDVELASEDYQGKPRYEELLGAIEPERDAVDYDAMTVDQVYKLARISEVAPLETMAFVAAAKACIKIGLTTFLDGAAPDRAEQVYGLIRQGWPNHAPGILSGDRSRIEDVLSAAADERQISRAAAADHASFVSELEERVVVVALDPATPGSLGALLGGTNTSLTSPPDPDQFAEVVAAWRDHTGTVADFWSGLEAATSLSAGQVSEVEFAVRLGVLTDNQADVVAGIMSELESSTDLRDAVEWDKSVWLTAIGAVDPDWIEGEDATARRNAYAEKMMALVEQAYPSARYRHIIESSSHVSSGAQTWLTTNPSVDIGTGHIAYDSTDEVNEVRALQRLYRIGPTSGRGEVMTEVLGAGYTSSYKIVSGGRKQFLAAMEGLIDDAVAVQVYNNAESAKAASALLLLQAHPNLNTAFGTAVGGADVETPPTELNDWATLFGEISSCACRACRSATSPTAYFVHLMQWLRERGGVVEIPGSAPTLFYPPLSGYSSPQHALASASGTRRPDLGLLKLICANTETPLPYVDLVVEVLEDAVVLSAINGWAISRTETTWSPSELMVAPEYAHSVAYEMLAGLRYPDPDPFGSAGDTDVVPTDFHYPMGLPYDHWADIQRTFLSHVNVSRARLWELWSGGTRVSADLLARERLGVTEREWGLLESGSVSMWVYWQTTSTDALANSIPGDEFTRRLRLEFAQAQELLRCRAAGAVTLTSSVWTRSIELVADGDACVFSDWVVQQVGDTPVTDEQMRGIARFARLARRVPWSFRELDSLLDSVGVEDVEGDLDATALREVAAALEIQRRYEIPVRELTLAWADFDLYNGPTGEDATYTPLYDTLFLNPRLSSDARSASYVLALDDDRQALVHTSTPLGDALALIAGALRTSTEQVVVAASWAGVGQSLPTLDVGNLSQICRVVFVARWLRWSASDLVAYLQTADISTIAASPLEFLSFLQDVQPLRARDIGGHQWSYWLRNDRASADALGVGWPAQAAALGRIREALRAALEGAKENQLSASALRRELAAALASELGLDVESVADLLERGDGEPEPFSSAFLAPAFLSGKGLPLEGDLTSDIVRSVPAVSAAADAFQRLQKVGQVVELLGLSREELNAWLDQVPGGLSLPDVFDLPYGAPELNPGSAATADSAWKNLLRVFSVRANDRSDLADMLRGDSADDDVLTDEAILAAVTDAAAAIPGGATEEELKANYLPWCVGLAEAARWDLSTTLQGCSLFSLTRDNGVGLAWLDEVMDASRRLGVRLIDLDSLVAPEDETEAARAVVAAVRGRHGEDASWVETAQGLRDDVRQRQRDALLTFLYEHGDPSTSTESEVYAHYLLDPKMDPWLMTTRMKAAAGSLQILTQRALLGLEQFTLDEQSERQWSWMKNYRVWEAARKVFLYPENWIEPDLRIEKTPFFEAFERELAESEPTDEHLQKAVTHYLESLYEVADLYMLSCHDEVWSDESGTTRERFHILARTHARPYSYWYRTREDDQSFTPWERVDAGLEGDRIQVFAAAGEVYLLSLVWDQVELPPSEAGDDKYDLKGRLSVARKELVGWSTRLLDDDAASFAIHRPDDGFSGTDSFEFQLYPAIKGDRLVIELGLANDENPNWLIVRGGWTIDPTTWETEYGYFVSTYGFKGGELLSPDGQGLTWTGAPFGVNDPAAYFVYLGGGSTLLEGWIPRARLVHPRQERRFGWDRPFLLRAPHRTEPGGATESQPFLRSFLITRSDRHPSDYLQDSELGFGSLYGHPNSFGVPDGLVSETDEISGEMEASNRNELPGPKVRGPFRFESLQHSWLGVFMEQVRREGALALLAPGEKAPDGLARQTLEVDEFASDYLPTQLVRLPRPVADIDFSRTGAYGAYNWELFFHGPLLVAKRLGQRMRFDEALKWLRTIFDPYDQSSGDADRFWKVRPLYEEDPAASVTNWSAFSGASAGDALAAFEDQVEAWEADPFNPHLLAQMRPGTYKKVVVMQFLDTLVEWGDHLFRQDTMETIQEATQLYILARDLLGARPPELPEQTPEEKDYNQLVEEHLDAFGNALVNIENMLGQINGSGSGNGEGASEVLGALVPYFCIPVNEKLLGYWDTVDDRLFKLRSGLNIEGIRRSLPLYQPPIDPALLVRARAMGLSLASVVGDLSKPLPKYRFQVLLQRAQGLAGTVRALGGALLSAYEKRDAERLSALRSTHEIAIGKAMAEVRGRQVAEARAQLDSVKRQIQSAETRLSHYQAQIDDADIKEEQAADAASLHAGIFAFHAGILSTISGFLGLIPQMAGGSAEFGGTQVRAPLEGTAAAMRVHSALYQLESQRNQTRASRLRREQDWTLQRDLAKRELAQLEKQELAAEIRLDIAQRERKIQQQQVDNARQVEEFLRTKFTNEQLYSWMVGQISTLYFQSYQLAYDLSKQAQLAYRHEMGKPDASFVQYGHFDSLHKGLLAGERLGLDLDRMDVAYVNADIRERELTRNISLDRLDPGQLLQLRMTGECTIEIPEWLLDMDFPGHFFRRIKSVGLTIASVVGRDQGVNAELTLLKSFRRDSLSPSFSAEDYRWASQHGDFIEETVAVSGALDDTGTFQVDFTGPRYMPFERRGAVSQWRLRLTGYPAQFDWTQIADVVMHLRYTARSQELARSAVRGAVDTILSGSGALPEGLPATLPGTGVRAISLARDLPDTWYMVSQDPSAEFTVTFANEYLRYGHSPDDVDITAVGAWIVGEADVVGVSLVVNGEAGAPFAEFGTAPFQGGKAERQLSSMVSVSSSPDITVELTGAFGLAPEDIVLVFQYTVS